jgi:hypothetical protein
MKIVRTILGAQKIEVNDYPDAMLKVREILDAHRSKLINRLMTDLPTYIDYKFHVKVSTKQIEDIKEKLASLKNSSVDMNKYGFIFQHVMAQDKTYVTTAPFYQEIDDNISWYLNESQLKLLTRG